MNIIRGEFNGEEYVFHTSADKNDICVLNAKNGETIFESEPLRNVPEKLKGRIDFDIQDNRFIVKYVEESRFVPHAGLKLIAVSIIVEGFTAIMLQGYFSITNLFIISPIIVISSWITMFFLSYLTNFRAKQIAEVIREGFKGNVEPEGAILIKVGNSYSLADLATGRCVRVIGGVSGWIRKLLGIIIYTEIIDNTLYLFNLRDNKQSIPSYTYELEVERIDNKPQAKKRIIGNFKGQLRDVYQDDEGILFTLASRTEWIVWFYDKTSGKLKSLNFGNYSELSLSHHVAGKYYFNAEKVSTDSSGLKYCGIVCDKSTSGLEKFSAWDEADGSYPFKKWLRYEGEGDKSYYLTVADENGRYSIIRKDRDGAALVGSTYFGYLQSTSRYVVFCGGTTPSTFYYWVLDMDTVSWYNLGTSEDLGIEDPQYILEAPDGFMLVGKTLDNPNKLIGCKITLPAVKPETKEKSQKAQSEPEIDYNLRLELRLKRLVGNLQHVQSGLLAQDIAILLPYVPHQVLNALTDDTIEDIKAYLQAKPDEREDFLRFFEALEPVLVNYTAEQALLNIIANNWFLQYQVSKEKAIGFIDAVVKEYDSESKLGRVSGVRLLELGNTENAPAQIRDFWFSLTTDTSVEARKEDKIEPMFSGNIKCILTAESLNLEGYKGIPLAMILFARKRMSKALNKRGLKLAEVGDILRQLPKVDLSGYNQDIRSAMRSQVVTTVIRELVQNARDAYRALRERLGSPKEHKKEPVYVNVYTVERQGGGCDLVLETIDNGIGMDAWVIFNKLWPLDQTTKLQHMGQGIYTILEDRIEIDTTKGDGLGYQMSGFLDDDQCVYFDTIKEVELPKYKEGKEETYRGTSVRQIKRFNTQEEAKIEYLRLEERLRFYCGAVRDVNIYLNPELNPEPINDKLELAAAVRLGELDNTATFIGGSANRWVHDGLAMLPLKATKDLWSDIPHDAQEEMFRFAVTTESAQGLLLTKNRDDTASEAHKPFERKAESLKAMLFFAGHMEQLSPSMEKRIFKELESAEQAHEDNPNLDEMAYYLNYQDTQDGNQRQFHLVAEEYMLKHFYQLLIRLKINTDKGKKSLLDIYREEKGLQPLSEKTYDIPNKFRLPPLQYKEKAPSQPDEAGLHLPEFDYKTILRLIKSLVNWIAGIGYEINVLLLQAKKRQFTLSKNVKKLLLIGIVALVFFVGVMRFNQSDRIGISQLSTQINSLYSLTSQADQIKVEFGSGKIAYWNAKRANSQDMLRSQQEGRKTSDQIVRSSMPPNKAYVLANVTGLREGEYAILEYMPNLNVNGPYAADELQVIPQGEETGEEVVFEMKLGNIFKGDRISLWQIKDGVPTRIEFDKDEGAFDLTHMADGYIVATRYVSGPINIREHIPRRTQNNKLVFDANFDARWMQEESNDLPAEWRAILDPVRGDNVSVEDKVQAVDELMLRYFAYNDTVALGPDGTWSNTAKRLLEARGSTESFCWPHAIYKQILLEYVGLEGIYADVYPYRGLGIIASNLSHADSYYIGQDGTLVESRWVTGEIRKVTGDYSVDAFAAAKEGKGIDFEDLFYNLLPILYIFSIAIGALISVFIVGKIFKGVLNRLKRFSRQRAKKVAAKETAMPISNSAGIAASIQRMVDTGSLSEDATAGRTLKAEALAQLGPLEMLGAQELLKNIITVILKDKVTAINIKATFDPKQPKFYFADEVLYINLYYYQKEAKQLMAYINRESVDKWQVFRAWLAIALEASYTALEKRAIPAGTRLHYYLDTILGLFNSRVNLMLILERMRVSAPIADNQGRDRKLIRSSLVQRIVKVDINLATIDELNSAVRSLPGVIGHSEKTINRLVDRIIERQQQGKITSIEDLKAIKGIGSSRAAALAKIFSFGAPADEPVTSASAQAGVAMGSVDRQLIDSSL